MKNLRMVFSLLLLSFIWSYSSLAGPGSSVGSLHATISSPTKGYLFQSPSPTKTIVGVMDFYEFKLHGLEVAIRPVAYDPKTCRLTNSHKTVCARLEEGRVKATIVFGDETTFRIIYTHRFVSGADLLQRFHAFASQFVLAR